VRIESDASGRCAFVIPGEPYYYTHNAQDEWQIGLETNEAVGAKALEAIQRYSWRPLLIFVHFAVVDHQWHKFGENSKEHEEALISCDTWTGKIMEALKKTGRLPAAPAS
jgi:hypothetical protein